MMIALALVVLLFVGGVVAVLLGWEAWLGTVGVCLLSMAFSAAVLSRRIGRKMVGRVPDFLTVFLAFQIPNKVMTAISLIAGDRYLKWYEVMDLVEPRYAFQAEWVHLATMVLFTLSWLLVERSWRRPIASAQPHYSPRMLIGFYLVVTVTAIALQEATALLSMGLLAAFMQFSALAAVGTLLASDTKWGLGGSWVWITLLLLAPPFYIAMSSGTKGALVVVALPVLMAGLTKGGRQVVGVVIPFAIFMLVIGIPLSQEMRIANWESYGAREEIGVVEGLSRVIDRYLTGDAVSVIEETTIRFCGRASSAEAGGVVMRITDTEGLIGIEPIASLPAIFVPRLLWPDKPVFQPGAWFTWYLGRATSPETATSATATMLGTEIYWMFGLSGFALAFMLGSLYALTWRGLVRISRMGLMGFAGMYALLGSAVRFEESFTVYAIASPIVLLAYAYALVLVEKLVRRGIAIVGTGG